MEVDLYLSFECKTFCIANKKYIFWKQKIALKIYLLKSKMFLAIKYYTIEIKNNYLEKRVLRAK